MGDEEETRLAQQVYLVIKADIDKDGKQCNSQVLGVYFTDNTALQRAQQEFADVLGNAGVDVDPESTLEEYQKAGDEFLICFETKEADKATGLNSSVRVEEHRVLDFNEVFETPGEEGEEEEEYEEDDGGEEDDGEEGDQQDEEDVGEAEDEEDEDEPPAKVARKRG